MVRSGQVGGSTWLLVAACLALVVATCGDATAPTVSAPAPDASSSTTSTPPAPLPPPWPTAGWPVATPEEVGMLSGVLAELVEQAVAAGGIDSLTVVRNGYAVLDTVVYPFPEDTTHIIHSCTKSVVSTLIGVAIDRDYLDGVDVAVVDVLPGHAPAEVDDRKAAMTVGDLLTMTSGLDCRDSYKYEWQGLEEMAQSDDWAAHVLDLPMSEEPGTRFGYCNGASFLLSAILSEVTGMPASEFAGEVLFGPLGITEFAWPANPAGITLGWGELRLRPADLAKLGYLYLHGGEWDGAQLVPASWIEAATTIHSGDPLSRDGYGYQWWVNWAGHPTAAGFAGQYLVVIPEHDIVVAFTGGSASQGDVDAPLSLAADPALGLLYSYVLPAVVSDDPLPPDPAGVARLAAAVAAAASGPEPVTPELPEIVARVDGVRYEVGPGDGVWFEFRFDGATAVVRGEDADAPYEGLVGLDGRYRIDDEASLALRGAWRSGSAFVVEYHVLGHTERGTYDFFFEDDTVEVRHREVTTGSFEFFRADAVG